MTRHRSLAQALFVTAAMLALAATIGVVLGLMSWHFWVIGLFGLMCGVALGWLGVMLGTWLRFGRRAVWALLVVSVFVAYGVLQVFEDAHQRQAFREVLFENRSAASGLPPAEIERLREVSGVSFLAKDADALLETEVVAATGIAGGIGRWVFRLEAGARLGGPYRGGRGVAIGIAGGILALVFELVVALVIGRRALSALGRSDEANTANGPPHA